VQKGTTDLLGSRFHAWMWISTIGRSPEPVVCTPLKIHLYRYHHLHPKCRMLWKKLVPLLRLEELIAQGCSDWVLHKGKDISRVVGRGAFL
jgi:hypothetical protein